MWKLTRHTYLELQKVMDAPSDDGNGDMEQLCRQPLGFPCTDHLTKTLFGTLQYGGSPVPFIRGTDVKANVFLFLQTAIPHHVIRRTDFADSTLPHIAAHPTYIEQLVERTRTGDAQTRDVLGLAAFLFAMKALHFSVYCADVTFSRFRRVELLFLAVRRAFQSLACGVLCWCSIRRGVVGGLSLGRQGVVGGPYYPR